MKGKLIIITVCIIAAVTSTTLPASAQPASAQPASTTQGGHSNGARPSTQQRHQRGQARRNQDQNVNPAWQAYKRAGGRLAKSAWQKAGQPRKD